MALMQHKRYSSYGWNLMNNNNSYINTLQQGELGILLGNKYYDKDDSTWKVREVVERDQFPLNAILEVRVGISSNQHFFDALIIDTDYAVRQVTSLPNFGKPNCLYIKDNTAYFWNGEKMVSLAGSSNNVQIDLSEYAKIADVNRNLSQIDNKIAAIESNITAISSQLSNTYTKDQGAALEGRVSVTESSIYQLDQKIKGLEGTTHFAGAGPLLNRPSSAKNGAIYVATDNNKEYIWVDNDWIELGDVTAEAERLTEIESNIKTINSQISSNNSSISQLALDIAKVKIEAAQDAATKAANAEANALSAVASIKSELENKISSNTNKFKEYYSKDEANDLISNGIGNIKEIYGGDSTFTPQGDK